MKIRDKMRQLYHPFFVIWLSFYHQLCCDETWETETELNKRAFEIQTTIISMKNGWLAAANQHWISLN